MRLAFRDSEGIPGGRYLAEQGPDGLWSIRDVPVMAELPAGARRNRERIGREWFLRAVANHERLEREQAHLAPVHRNHHGDGLPTPRIGFLRLRRVGQVRLGGRSVDALFADLCGISDPDLQAIQELEFPYRSVEVHRWSEPEIASLALLTDEAPFFKLPMLSIGEARAHPLARTEIQREDAPALCASAADSDERNLILFRLEDRMPSPSNGQDPTNHPAGAPSRNGDPRSRKTGQLADDDRNGDGNGDDDPKMQQGDVTQKVSEVVEKKVNDFLANLPKLIEEALNAMAPGTSSPEPDEAEPAQATPFRARGDGQTDDTQRTQPKRKGEGPPAEGAHASGEVAKLHGRIAALEDKVSQRDQRDERESLVGGVRSTLEREGYELSDSTVEKMRDIASVSQDPKKALEIFSASYRETVPRDPARHLDDVTGPSHETDPEEVMKFSSRGPETLQRARELSREFDALREAGLDLQSSREEYIEFNLEPAASS